MCPYEILMMLYVRIIPGAAKSVKSGSPYPYTGFSQRIGIVPIFLLISQDTR